MNTPLFVPRSCPIKRTHNSKCLGVACDSLVLASIPIMEVAI
jgi:hypothetical protein